MTAQTYTALVRVHDPDYAPANLADRFAWMNAIQRGAVEVVTAHEQPPAPVDAPAPSSLLGRLAECERHLNECLLEQERLGDAICGLHAADEELSARIDAAGRQHAALVERVMDMGGVKTLRELVHDIDARLHALEDATKREPCRDCVWIAREAE